IMHDSRIGAFGAMALVLALLLKVALLAMLGAHNLTPMLAALLGGHVLSRLCPLVLVASMTHIGDAAGSKSKPLADQISGPALACAELWCVPALAWLGWSQGPAYLLCAMAASAAALGWMARLFRRRLQGFTGDCLGATQQVCEMAFYLGAAVGLGWP
ncbi:MAG: adenosylcobinamide-GDP ribazoletransferase, partial [Microbacteriaceae bacterium]|nr:adenosylcobinamide-GDP ribazoletransferase [Burkholderiaceae bacterium]